jgi:hypothetical protein
MTFIVIPAKARIPAGERHLRSSPPGAPACAGVTDCAGLHEAPAFAGVTVQ